MGDMAESHDNLDPCVDNPPFFLDLYCSVYGTPGHDLQIMPPLMVVNTICW